MMSIQKLNISSLREHIKKFQFEDLFIELGWERPDTQKKFSIQIDNLSIPYTQIAKIKSVPVLKLDQTAWSHFQSEFKRQKLHSKIKKAEHKHLLLFSDDQSFLTLSYFSKDQQVRSHSWFKWQSEDDFIGKLKTVHFAIDEGDPSIVEIGKKLETAFDSEKVTKRFFNHFKENHLQFQKYISGIKDNEEKKWYASIILNRLMFIWFLQKRGFLDDGNSNYLEDKLEWSKNRKKDSYYSEFLKLLFFQGFAKKPQERNDRAKKHLGNIKYLNGGLFVPHTIEDKYKNKIQIQDRAFEETFKIFNTYEWHLQDTRLENYGEDKDISPDIMGHIFEKYINDTQRKSQGAYYTRDEITRYLSRNTIQSAILDKVNKRGYDFDDMANLLHKLDAPLCKLLLTNEDSILNTLTILDPAVGSGAFLVSAMKELIEIYSPIIRKIQTLGDRDLKKWIADFKQQHKSIAYGIKKSIILKNLYGVDIMKEATEVCKLRLFLSLVSSALNQEELEPLPNLDYNIMCGNSLIGFLNEENKEQETEEQFQWDAVLGKPYKQLKKEYNKMTVQYKNKSLSFDGLKNLKKEIDQFLEKNSSKLNLILADKCNKQSLKYQTISDIKGSNKIFGNKRAVKPNDFYSKKDERNLKPFHWDFAFNEIIAKGGFDVIVTNPPWDKVKIEDKEFFYKYDGTIDKKKTKSKVMKRKKKQLLKKSDIKKDYLKTEELYQFQRNYFSKLYQYQSGKIQNPDGKNKKSSSDMDAYRLFIERCFNLLGKNGFLGAVLPSGLHKDDGAIGLRKNLLFKKVKIEGLIDFQNQMANGMGKIFEGVDSRFKFLLLTFKKDKPQDKFPCQFNERNLKVLDEGQFPKNSKMYRSIKEIQEQSPRDCSIIEFKNLTDRKFFRKISKFPQLAEKIENLWNPVFYSEFHETNDSNLFKSKQSSDKHLPLYKGGAIYQYEFNHDISIINRYISINSKKVQGRGFPFQNKCYQNYRLVIRTIASKTNERSLISAVIPKNHFISNSLHGVYVESSKPSQNNKYMLLLQAFLNSFIVDYLIRQKVSANINQKYIAPLNIPRLTEKDPYFKEIVERSAQLTCIGKEFNELANEIGIPRGGVKDETKRWKIQAEIDAMVAYVYGLILDEFKHVLDTFTTGNNQNRLQSLKKYALEAFKKDRFLSKTA